MIRIIVVDDDIEMCRKANEIIKKFMFKIENEIKINNFTKMDKELLEIINDNCYPKIYILDIELQSGDSGIQIARLIREKDWDSQIIFMTNHDKMFETVYRNVYQVFDFIEKFHDFDNRLSDDLNRILNMKFDSRIFYYMSRNIDLQIYLKSILYIYRDTLERKIIIVTQQNKFAINLNINEVLDYLDDRFKIVHRACIVNTDHVQKYDWTNKLFILDTGEKVGMLSKSYKKTVIKR